ncbi:MAG: ribonucleoside-triphosphate reductase [Desulfovibrio sp.]|uniref:anaerobic ribonucleoside-triphosphate reductase n=1 Tax=Desulfovibrio sp. TaxID=885 RepID=UPI0025836E72|nr:anaerobic ribonucleoside-triphosphate reductase [Desulfovibrio sp.]MCD7983739.1 ribonucleoside-triphosphate reductase [Desulfovibrio sp.]
MPLQLPQTYDEGFVALIERLRKKYPAELFLLTGIHESQLDINHTSREYFSTANRKGSATADHSIDPNANVTGRDVITFNYEVPKPLMKMNSLYNLWKEILRFTDAETADLAVELEISGYVYINDSWDIGRPYCFNYSTLDIALEGLKMGGRLNIVPPKSLSTLLRQIEQFTVYAANSTLGATGLADMLIVISRYVDMILDGGREGRVYHDNHVCVGSNRREVWTYVRECLTSLIYTLNWEFRGNQSPFTNVSVYDTPFLEKLLPSYVIQGEAPRLATVQAVQEAFLDCFNEVLSRDPATFPVVTACFSLAHDEREGKHIADRAFLRMVAEKNLKYGFINFYIGETSTLSSCCRLRSNINDLGYANSFGAGSTKIGSLGVCTLNLPALAREVNANTADKGVASALDAMCVEVGSMTAFSAIINHAKRNFIQDRIKRGSLPLYSLGFMDLKHQYSTCGFTGLYEALNILGYDIREPEGLAAARRVLGTINAANELATSLFGTPHNMEQVPGESSAVKLAKKDSLLGRNPEAWPLYSNQFIPLWEEGVDLLDRIRIQGELDRYCTGGAICHLNVGDRIEKVEVMEALVSHAAACGVVYFAVNYAINRCENGHMSVGRDAAACPLCGAVITDTFTRVVGFLTNTKHWNSARREHDWPKRVFYRKAE